MFYHFFIRDSIHFACFRISIFENFEEDGLNKAIQALENHVSITSRRYSYLYPLSILPILDYLLRKEKEVRNLRTIVRGKDLKLSNERIKEIMVV